MSDSFLSSTELEKYVKGCAETSHFWEHFVEHGDQRIYKQLTTDMDPDIINCWLICWNEGHDTGFHDHDGSAGGVAVVRGRVSEERLHRAGNNLLEPKENIYATNETFKFGPYDIHRVKHVGDSPAVTIHAYSPPLERMGSFGFGVDGEFRRQPLSSDQELRPLEVAVQQ